MAYDKTEWKNREVERPRTYNFQNNEDGTITLIPAEGTIIEPGTPIIAQNMNKIEDALVIFDEHFVDFEQQMTLKANKQQEAWMNLTLINGWAVAYGNQPAFRKNEFGEVWLQGLVRDGVEYLVANLPEGYRPFSEKIFSSTWHNYSNELYAIVHVYPNGDITVSAKGSSVVNWLSLDGIHYNTK